MKCRLCGSDCNELFSAVILSKYEIQYHQCETCKLLQTEKPYWLEEAYKNPINSTDVGLLARNFDFAEKIKPIIFFFFDRQAQFLDYAGGYGIFTRIMRDFGFDFYWHDPYTENSFAKGFESSKIEGKVELVTSFESFEHFVNPMEEISKIVEISQNIIFSTLLLPKRIPSPDMWWYYGLEHGQHISFYSASTLSYIANEFGLNYCSINKNLHMFTKEKINKSLLNLTINYRKYLQRYMNKRLVSKTFSDSRILIGENK